MFVVLFFFWDVIDLSKPDKTDNTEQPAGEYLLDDI